MYEKHFGLAKPPFKITPDPEFFFPGGNRGAVLEALVYAVLRGEGIIKVVGEVGSGKTMLCRMLEQELPHFCQIVYLVNPRLTQAEILHAIAFELGLDIKSEDDKLKVQHALQAYLLAKHAENIRVIVFIEEAQGMPIETLEEIRILSNLETTRDKLLQIILFGQPELEEKLNQRDIRQLRERITHGFALAPFDIEQIRDYVSTRIRATGYRGNELFEADAIKELEHHSNGLLRRINVLADKALLAAFAANDTVVRPTHVKLAARDSEFGARYRPPLARRRVALAACFAMVAIGLTWVLMRDQEILPPVPAARPLPAELKAGANVIDTPVVADDAPAPATGALERQTGDSKPSALNVHSDTAWALEFDDNQPMSPVISEATGWVTIEHLRPQTGTRLFVPDLRAQWAPGND